MCHLVEDLAEELYSFSYKLFTETFVNDICGDILLFFFN